MRETEGQKGTERAEGTPTQRTPFEFIEKALWQPGAKAPAPRMDSDPGARWERHRPKDEEGFGHIRGFQRQGGNLAPTPRHRGSAASWVAVGLAFVGFALIGLAVVLDGTTWLLVAGGILMVAAGVVAVAFDMLADVVLDPPRFESEEPHTTPLHQIRREQERRRG